ncbi:MAG TPA: hypothetical protein VEB86_01635 [Chryseosolibacter sp.]|nr:hypothetical protein [Chryseosolibacter sp.]
MRETLGAFMDKKWPTVEKAFNRLKDKDKVFAFTKLLPFITPQYSSINFSLKNMTEQDLETIINHLKNSENEEQENGINGPD